MRWVAPALLAMRALAGPVMLDVPYVAQEKSGCGAAVIAMVLGYWEPARPARPAVIHQRLYSREARGVLASGMQRYFREQGFRVFAFEGAWEDLRDHLGKGRPLIVALKPGRGDLHYVVVTGIDAERELVVTHDPAVRRSVCQSRGDFERHWKGSHHWTLLALPESR